ncbi:MAG: aminotransferase class V-fold PLP-dependent enzyme [Anaerolineae bacterium]|nr:aminotransferase class V-fold PLP-dependent enzyme [Anaerolineae bacterium]
MDVVALRAGIPALQQCIYLNCGTYGPLPTVVADELVYWYRRIEAEGSYAYDVTDELLEQYEAARRAAAALIHADEDEITLTRNVSEGADIIANGMTWHPGDEVILTEEEHPGGAGPWLNLAQRQGIVIKLLPITHDRDEFLERLERLITSRTRLVYVSHVSCISGIRLPVREIAEISHRKGTLIMVDGAHSVGQFPVDVHALDCDFYTTCGHKWLSGPQGTGFLYIRRELLPEIAPTFVGWDSVEHYDLQHQIFEPRPDARRFEFSTRPWPLYPALRVAIERVQKLDPAEIERTIRPMVQHVEEALSEIPDVSIMSPRNPAMSSGLVAFTHTIPGEVKKKLWEEHRILVGANDERHWIRLSVNAYVLPEELDYFVDVLRQLATNGTNHNT